MPSTAQQLVQAVSAEIGGVELPDQVKVQLRVVGLSPERMEGVLKSTIHEGVNQALGVVEDAIPPEIGEYADEIATGISMVISAIDAANTAAKIKEAIPGWEWMNSAMRVERNKILRIMHEEGWAAAVDVPASQARHSIEIILRTWAVPNDWPAVRRWIRAAVRAHPHDTVRRRRRIVRDATRYDARKRHEYPTKPGKWAVPVTIMQAVREFENFNWAATIIGWLGQVMKFVPVLSSFGETLMSFSSDMKDTIRQTLDDSLTSLLSTAREIARRIIAGGQSPSSPGRPGRRPGRQPTAQPSPFTPVASAGLLALAAKLLFF